MLASLVRMRGSTRGGRPVADWIETYKGAVLTAEYDADSHMNTRLYAARFDQATWFLLATIGITPASVRRQRRRVAIVRQSFQFLRELRGGELVVIRSGFIAVGRKHLRFVHRMFETESDRMVATSDCTAVQASLKSGRSVLLPPSRRTAAEAFLVTWNVAEDAAPTAPAKKSRPAGVGRRAARIRGR